LIVEGGFGRGGAAPGYGGNTQPGGYAAAPRGGYGAGYGQR